MEAIAYSQPNRRTIAADERLLSLLGAALRWLLGTVLTLIGLLPPLLLFVNTGVPRPLVVLLLIADLGLGFTLLRRRSWRHVLGFYGGLVAVAVLAVWLSQRFAATPPITDDDSQPLPNSIATLEQVTLGGSKQWITIRGHDVNNPVLLYLGIGGPGAGGFPANAMMFRALEEHFVVVNWDQPGTGKSYGAAPIATLTVDRFVADAHELTELLRSRFQQEKIYVFGLSWGTILGTKLVQQYPELFYAYVGNGQMVNTTENDRLGYQLALQLADKWNEGRTFDTLRRNGPPPYDGPGMALKYAAYNNVLFRSMDSPTLDLVLLLVPQFAPEYGLVDRVNFARGLAESFPVIYPQLRELDFTTQAAQMAVPMYFLVGRQDVNAMASLVERYYEALQAPHKELIWLASGHGATPEELTDALVNKVLAQTQVGEKLP
jgi:pimeloyl-ACP methyl ester carboxylesterase